ncbi:MAG: DUF4412 domain-containing protein [Bacteroidota bacterium]
MPIKKIFFPIVIILTLFLTSWHIEGHAQINRLRRKLDEKIDRKIEQKAEELADRILDKALEGDSTDMSNRSDDSTRFDRLRNMPFGEADYDATIEPQDGDQIYEVEPNEFTGSLTITTESFKKNGKPQDGSPFVMEMSIIAYQFAMETPTEDKSNETSVTVFDSRTRKIATKIDGKEGKQAIIIKIPSTAFDVEDEDMANGDYTIKATGATKTVEGYLCKEYRYDSDDYEGLVWIAEDFPINYAKLFGTVTFNNSKNGNSQTYENIFPSDGAPIESYSTNKKTGEKSSWKISNIREGQVNEELFSLKGYPARDMSKFSDMLKGKN